MHTIGGAPTVTNLGVAAEKVLAVGGDIVFTRPESAEPLMGIYCADSGSATCDLNRITSYNVCYTKLLRVRAVLTGRYW